MKIVCSKNELTKGINIVSKAVPSRTTMSILECILIDCNQGSIKLIANDMDLGIETVVKGFTTAKIKTDLLEKEKVLQLLCDMLNRGDNIPIEKLMDENTFQSRYTTGEMTFQERTIGGNLNG